MILLQAAVHTSDTVDVHDASVIPFAPTGTLAATDVQAAIAEAASETIQTSVLTTSGDILTRGASAPDRITRASLAADTAFTSQYSPISVGVDQADIIGLWDPTVSLSGLADGTALRLMPDRSRRTQSRAGDDRQPADQADRPRRAAIRFAANHRLSSSTMGAGFHIFPQPLSLVAVIKSSSSNSGYTFVGGGDATSGRARINVDSPTGVADGHAGANGVIAGPTIHDDAWHVVVVVMDTLSVATTSMVGSPPPTQPRRRGQRESSSSDSATLPQAAI